MGIGTEIWFPVVTLVLGLVIKAAFDALSDNRTLRREREARRELRMDALRLRRGEFQRETLLALQEAISRMARFTGRANYEDMVNEQTSGDWRASMLSEDIDKGFLEAQTVRRQHPRHRFRVEI